MNLIPGIAISRVEVLRDGAAAQYGSDAIAGVINIQLKSADHGGRVAYLPLTEIDRAVAEDERDGFLKVIAGPRFGTVAVQKAIRQFFLEIEGRAAEPARAGGARRS